MSRRPALAPYPLPAQDLAPVFDAVADAASIAAVYAKTTADFAGIRDAKGIAYGLRCAAAAIETAASLADELRPAGQSGGRA